MPYVWALVGFVAGLVVMFLFRQRLVKELTEALVDAKAALRAKLE
jgi:hypothetical protein